MSRRADASRRRNRPAMHRDLPRHLVPLLLTAALAAGWGCSVPDATPAGASEDLLGSWRAVLASPGGELPFTLEITHAPDGSGGLRAAARNGDEAAPLGPVTIDGDRIVIATSWYDATITATWTGPDRLRGEWRRTAAGGAVARLAFSAARADLRRFLPAAPPRSEEGGSVAGTWSVTFRDDAGTEAARGEFEQQGERVVGTFLTPSGDYRYLEGSFEGGRLRLSTFDGSHAFLFVAAMDGPDTLRGDFWSHDTYHAAWTARRVTASDRVLPDAWSLVGLRSADGRLHFAFPDLDGNLVSSEDPRFRGKVVVVDLFGSWCPNCNDEAPLLAAWDRRYRARGLALVGLAFEYTGDAERDRLFVRRYAARHGLEFPLLLAGTSDKAAAAAELPDLSGVVAFPTTIFIDRRGRVRRIHSGFAGPGTGRHHEELVAELEALLEALLAEPA